MAEHKTVYLDAEKIKEIYQTLDDKRYELDEYKHDFEKTKTDANEKNYIKALRSYHYTVTSVHADLYNLIIVQD